MTAADIECNADVGVLNPELHIVSLSKDAVLDMETTVERGRGYVQLKRTRSQSMQSA